MKKQKILAAFAILSIAFLAGCLKDTFKETIGVCPLVMSVNPSDGAQDIPFNQVITATFNEKMNPATITAASFTIRGANLISGVITYTDSTASFRPNQPLSPSTTYTGTISTAVKDVAGNALQVDYVWTFSTSAFFVDLQSAAQFGIFASVAVVNNAGQSEIHNMDVGISPGLRTSIIGFPPAILLNGNMFAADDLSPQGVPAMLIQAKQDLTQAYLATENLTFPAATIVSGDLGGSILNPGIYRSTSSLLIQSGDLILDAQGNENALWVFQIGSGLSTVGGAGGNVILTGGAQAKNIYWQTGSSATIGDFTSFKGNVLALTSITLNSGATVDGRMLALNGSVILTNTNIIRKP